MGSLRGEPLDWGITLGTGPNKTTISIQTALAGRRFGLLEQNWHHAVHGKAAWREPGFVPWEMGSLFPGRPGSEEGSQARDQQQSRREPWAPGCIQRPQDGSGKGSDPGWVFLVFLKKKKNWNTTGFNAVVLCCSGEKIVSWCFREDTPFSPGINE